MVKTYADLYLDARKALLPTEGMYAGNIARELVCAASGKTQEALIADRSLYASEEICARVENFVRRHITGEPTAYIVGAWEFFGLELSVDPNVLIPRSDTEVVTEAALGYLREKPDARVLDLCTGSGCIGLALAANAPGCRVVLADFERRALILARQNVRNLGLSARCVPVEADALAAPARQLGEFDLIVSNPPYVPSGELGALEPSVRDYEPWIALDGGEDGLDFYRSIFGRWTAVLRPGGCLALECGEEQSAELLRMGREVGLTEAAVHRDTGGTERALTFRKPEEQEKTTVEI